MSVKTRFAPSPTGYLHIGGARTALFSWLYARKMGGEFVLRIEDTDRARSTDQSVQAILDSMAWLGLDCDVGPLFQTQRFDRYQSVIQQLLDEDKAYYCYCSKQALDAMRAEQMARKEKPRYNGYWRDSNESPPVGVEPVVRFKTPQSGQVSIDDQVYGKIVIENSELDDLIIARSDGTPTYNFCVVVDDWDMEITHVIRGEDHINNTSRQIHILNALGADVPIYAHLPMILGDDGKRLSKRHGAVSVMQYRESGYLPEALLNYLARLGWSHGDRELFSLEELVELFDLSGVNKSGAMFNPEKLAWTNRQYLQANRGGIATKYLAEQLTRHSIDPVDGPPLAEVVTVMAERTDTLAQMADRARYFFEDFEHYDSKAAKKQLRPIAEQPLRSVYSALVNVNVNEWQRDTINAVLTDTVERLHSTIGKVGPPLRVAVTGSSSSPPLAVTLELIGKVRVLQRLERALDYIDTRKSAT